MFETLWRVFSRVPVDLSYSYDGSCLFHSVAHVFADVFTAQELRVACCQIMASSRFRDSYSDFLPEGFADEVAAMRRRDCWGDSYALMALGMLLKTKFTVVSGDIVEVIPNRRAKYSVVLALEEDHYFPTRKVRARQAASSRSTRSSFCATGALMSI